MVTPDPMEAIEVKLREFAGDERMKSLFLWGAYTDRRQQPCESCGTPIVLLENAYHGDLTHIVQRWMEITQDNGPDITDLVFHDHIPARCKQLRKRKRP